MYVFVQSKTNSFTLKERFTGKGYEGKRMIQVLMCAHGRGQVFGKLHGGSYALRDKTSLSSILAWRMSWTEEPSRLQSIGSQRVGHF